MHENIFKGVLVVLLIFIIFGISDLQSSIRLQKKEIQNLKEENQFIRRAVAELPSLVMLEMDENLTSLDEYLRRPRVEAPYDRIGEDQIFVLDDRIVLKLGNATWSRFTDTDSMKPVLDTGSNAIQIIPLSRDDVHVGDIISYEFEGDVYVHRVMEIGYDDDGWYATTKGDNNYLIDPIKIRFENIRRILVGIIY